MQLFFQSWTELEWEQLFRTSKVKLWWQWQQVDRRWALVRTQSCWHVEDHWNLLWMQGFSKLIIEGDNVNVMQAISSSANNFSLLGYVVDDIRHLVHCLEWARISITRRGGNKVAHALAQHARNSSDNDVYWIEDSPPSAVEALIQDVLLLWLYEWMIPFQKKNLYPYDS